MIRKSKIFVFLMLAFIVLAYSGCGYTTRSAIRGKYATIYVSPFINKVDITNESYTENKYRTYRPFIETEITQAVIDKFLSDGNLRPTTQELADLILKGEFVEFRRDPLRYDKDDEVIEYRLNLVVRLILWDTKENRAVWEESRFTGDTTYFTTESGVSGAKTDDQAINDALVDLARRVVERVVEDW